MSLDPASIHRDAARLDKTTIAPDKVALARLRQISVANVRDRRAVAEGVSIRRRVGALGDGRQLLARQPSRLFLRQHSAGAQNPPPRTTFEVMILDQIGLGARAFTRTPKPRISLSQANIYFFGFDPSASTTLREFTHFLHTPLISITNSGFCSPGKPSEGRGSNGQARKRVSKGRKRIPCGWTSARKTFYNSGLAGFGIEKDASVKTAFKACQGPSQPTQPIFDLQNRAQSV